MNCEYKGVVSTHMQTGEGVPINRINQVEGAAASSVGEPVCVSIDRSRSTLGGTTEKRNSFSLGLDFPTSPPCLQTTLTCRLSLIHRSIIFMCLLLLSPVFSASEACFQQSETVSGPCSSTILNSDCDADCTCSPKLATFTGRGPNFLAHNFTAVANIALVPCLSLPPSPKLLKP